MIDYNEIINRMNFFRSRAGLSLRDCSVKLGMNPQFMKTIENKGVELKVKTLLDFCSLMGITIEEFFYLGSDFSKDDREIFQKLSTLSLTDKKIILDLINKLTN